MQEVWQIASVEMSKQRVRRGAAADITPSLKLWIVHPPPVTISEGPELVNHKQAIPTTSVRHEIWESTVALHGGGSAAHHRHCGSAHTAGSAGGAAQMQGR